MPGHPKSALEITAWDQSLVYDGPERYPSAFYRKIISTVEKAKPRIWKIVSLDYSNDSAAITYVKNRWAEFVDNVQTLYQLPVTKKNFTLLCGEWLIRKHNLQPGRKGAEHCAISTVQRWATAVCKAFLVFRNARKRKNFIPYAGLTDTFPVWRDVCNTVKRAAPLRRIGEPKNWLRQRDLIHLWIKMFKGTEREQFGGLDTLDDGQYFALHEMYAYGGCCRGGEIVRVHKSGDPEHNRTHIGLYHNNFGLKIYDNDYFDVYGLDQRCGLPRGMLRQPSGIVGWLDRQKNETMVSGDVHNKFYIELSDSIPAAYTKQYKCLEFCNHKFMIETLLGIRITPGMSILPVRSDGISPLFPARANIPHLNKLLDRYDAGESISEEDMATYFVNEEKSWFDSFRKVAFSGLVPVDKLANVSGHCWRGGLRPLLLSCF